MVELTSSVNLNVGACLLNQEEGGIQMAATKRRRVEMPGEGLDTSTTKHAGPNGPPTIEEDSTSSTDSDNAWLDRKIQDRFESESESEGASTSSDDISSSSDEDDSSPGEGNNATDAKQPPADLKARLAAFLPQLAKANETLSESGRVDDVDDDEERYIEMNLGLGVLAEKREEDHDVRTKESESDSSLDADSGDELLLNASEKQGPPQKKRKIEEVS